MRNRRVNDRAPDPVAPFGPGRGNVSAHHGAVEKLHQMCRFAPLASSWKKASNTPDRLSRQNRFQILFQLPNRSGSARQVMLWTVK